MANNIQETLEQFIADTRKHIDEMGHIVIATKDERGINMSYTVGRSRVGKPEIICYLLPPDVARVILNSACARDVQLDTPTEGIANLPLVFKAVDPEVGSDNLNVARAIAEIEGNPLSVIQLVIPDAAGLFPWDKDCDPSHLTSSPP